MRPCYREYSKGENQFGHLLKLIFNKTKMLNSKQKGNITELETILAFVKMGYNVLTPYGDCERYDFVVDSHKKLFKVQSKTATTHDSGRSFKISCRSTHKKKGKTVHHRYTSQEIDYFITSFQGKIYMIPVEECGSAKILRLENSNNNQIQNINLAKNYELEEVVKYW